MVVQTTIAKLPSSVEEIGWPSSKMTARATLICRQNSHPFQERTLLLDQPVKVGRSVARARPAVNNAIFDCKVLSRNHALLWYENGKFYLQDTKSSNGTFVNNQRLSKGSEESPPREVCSGDIVQFGVDVMENSRKGKVTHGCIVATLKIFLPDGKEAKASPSTAVLPPITSPGSIPTQELYQLAQYLQEALHREQLLENKLATLQKLVANSRDASESGWKALIDEDRLLTRLEILESQLQTYSKNFGEDKLRDEVSKLQDDKNNYQISAKESLMKVLQEKLETMRKLQDVEHNLGNAEFECVHVREMYAKTQVDFQEMATKFNNQLQELQELTEKIQEAQRKHDELLKTTEDEKMSLQTDCEKLKKEEETLQTKIESLQADNDFTHQQLTAMKARLESMRQGKLDGDTFNDVEMKIAPLMESQETQVDLLLERIEGDMECNLKGALRHTEDEVTKLKRQLQVSEKELLENKDKVNELQKLLEQVLQQIVQSMNKIPRLEEQLRESNFADENVGAITKHLQDEILRLEEELKRAQSASDSALILCKNGQNQENGSNTLHNHVSDSEANITNSLKAEIEQLKELLAETREKKKLAESEAAKYKGQLDDTCNLTKRYTDESAVIRQQLQIAQQLTKDKSEVVARLQEQLSKAEATSKQQMSKLQEKLAEEVQHNKMKIEETNLLKQQLLEAQQNNKQFHNEAEKRRNQIKALMEELGKHTSSVTDRRNSDEYLTLKEDCASLRNRVHMVEAELRKTRNENTKLLEDYATLKESLQEHEIPAHVSSTFRDDGENGDDEMVPEEAKKQLSEAENEIMQLRMQNTQCNEEKGRLKDQLQTLDEEYRLLLYQTRTISACSIIPLILFILGIALAFYPTLASITATNESSNPP